MTRTRPPGDDMNGREQIRALAVNERCKHLPNRPGTTAFAPIGYDNEDKRLLILKDLRREAQCPQSRCTTRLRHAPTLPLSHPIAALSCSPDHATRADRAIHFCGFAPDLDPSASTGRPTASNAGSLCKGPNAGSVAAHTIHPSCVSRPDCNFCSAPFRSPANIR
jgi:hypothetical protein